jgi:adenylate cyclase
MERARFWRNHPSLAALAIAALASLAVLGARQRGWLERLELAALDRQVEWISFGEARPVRVALVEVSEQDIQNLGHYPLSDADLALAIERISGSGARAIGIDVYRDIPVPPGTEKLTSVLTSQPRVIVPSKFADAGASGVGPPAALAGTPQVGFNNMVTDRDGSSRRGLLYMEDVTGEVGVAMSFLLALLYLEDQQILPSGDPDDPAAVLLGPSRFEPLDGNFGGYANLDAGGFQYAVDYRDPQSFPTASLTDVLAGEADPALFRDRIVVLGVAAESLVDRFRIPVANANEGEISGAELHGRLADQLVRSGLGLIKPRRASPDGLEVVTVLIGGLLAGALMLWMQVGWGLALLGFGGLGAFWALGSLSLAYDYWIPVVAPSLAWVFSLTVVAAYTRTQERAERAEIMQLFSRHVTKQVAEDVWQHRDEFLEGGRPRPVRLTATILFIDIKGYSGTAEKMDPGELMEWIDGFLGAMAQEVLDRGGLVEDYFGDGMMACYGIPVPRTDREQIRNDATNAVHSALAMEQTLHRLNTEWQAQGRPSIGIRVGICTGNVVAGSMGSANRLKYGVVGNAVVTAQRLESLGLDRVEHDFEKQLSRILISQETLAQIGSAFLTEPVGEFALKGKNEPVIVYRVLGRSAPGIEASEE